MANDTPDIAALAARLHELERRYQRLRRVAVGVLLLFVMIVAMGATEANSSLKHRLIPLLRPNSATELEWRLALARLSEVEEQVRTLGDSGISSCCTYYGFDPSKNKIVGRMMFSPERLNKLTVEEARKRLTGAALGAVGAVMAELQQQPYSVKTDEKDFEIEFVTWDDHAKFKQFAVYRNGQLELIDRKLE